MVHKFVINDGKGGKSYQKEIEEGKIVGLMGLKIGSEFDGGILGLPGYRLIITGGSDREGFPMRKDVDGIGKKRILLTKGIGYRPKENGIRRRKGIRGNTISQDIIQVNTKITKYGKTDISQILKTKEKPEEAPEEKKAEEKPKEEVPKEEAPKEVPAPEKEPQKS
jgi:small subunit ribosomal protein S6e